MTFCAALTVQVPGCCRLTDAAPAPAVGSEIVGPSNLTPEQLRIRTYYHESGHALAAVIRDGYVTSMDMNLSYIVETSTNLKKADKAFMVWAGPWAQAYWEGNCTVDRIMELFQTQSWFDWPVYEEARDGLRAAEMDVRGAAGRAEIAEGLKRPRPEDLPPVTPPEPGWHTELTKAWPELKHLAESLLRGDSRIHLSNGQDLVLDASRNYEYWWDPNEPTVDDEEES
jgi:hypothetical protein